MEIIGITKIDGSKARENSGISGREEAIRSSKFPFMIFGIVSGIPNVHVWLDKSLARHHPDARIVDVKNIPAQARILTSSFL